MCVSHRERSTNRRDRSHNRAMSDSPSTPGIESTERVIDPTDPHISHFSTSPTEGTASGTGDTVASPDASPTTPTGANSSTGDDLSIVGLQRLMARYADLANRQAWNELSSVMIERCALTLDLGDTRHAFASPQEFAAFIVPAMERFEFFQFSVLNSRFEVSVDGATAVGRTTILEHRQLRLGSAFSHAYGVYHDRFVRQPSGWRFATRWYQSLARTADPETSTTLALGPAPTFWRLGDSTG